MIYNQEISLKKIYDEDYIGKIFSSPEPKAHR